MRRGVSIGVVAGLCLLLVGVAGWLYLWDGRIDDHTFGPGDQPTVGKLTFTVPVGWEGLYDRYADVPSWVPLGAARPGTPVRESLTLRKATTTDSPEDLFVAVTYYGRYAPAGLAGLPRVAASQDVQLYSGARTMIGVVSEGDARVYLLGDAQADPTAAMRRLWRVLDVRGAVSP